MGVIQNALNQMVGTIGVAARLDPNFEKRAELADIKNKMAGYKKQAGAIQNLQGDITKEEAQIAGNLASNITTASERRLELDPTGTNLERHKQNLKAAEELKTAYSEAMKKVASKQDTQKTQKRNFKDYLRRLEIAGGGTVGELPKHAQNAIAKQYSRKERKELMDRMDSEQGGNK